MPKIRNIIIFTAIGVVLVLFYVFFIKASPSPATLVSSTTGPLASNTLTEDKNSSVAKDFLILLLSVTNIKLDDAIFSDNAFASLHDSSIILIPDGNEGRINPFAPLGTDIDTALPLIIPTETPPKTPIKTSPKTPTETPPNINTVPVTP